MNEIVNGSLFINTRGQMYVVDEIKPYKYKGETKYKVNYYTISGESGLKCTTKLYSCNMSDIGTKYTLLDWRF